MELTGKELDQIYYQNFPRFTLIWDSLIIAKANDSWYKLCDISSPYHDMVGWYPFMGMEICNLAHDSLHLRDTIDGHSYLSTRNHFIRIYTIYEFDEYHIFDTMDEFIDFVKEGGLDGSFQKK